MLNSLLHQMVYYRGSVPDCSHDSEEWVTAQYRRHARRNSGDTTTAMASTALHHECSTGEPRL